MRRPEFLAALILPLSLLAAPLAAQETAPAAAQGTEKTTIAAGIGVFGAPKLADDFQHLPYVNPDAPKGGEFSMSWTGGFDSFNPYTVKGRAAIMSSATRRDAR